MLVGAVDSWRKWALYTMPEGCAWHEGSVALLGDAVHGMLPFAAQGAGMAIEDAAVLSNVLSEAPLEPGAQVATALRRYGKMRRARHTRAAARATAGPHLSHGRRHGARARS